MAIKVIATLFAIYAWTRVALRFGKRKASIKELIAWTAIWLGIIIVVLYPSETNILARLIGMGRGFDALVFGSMLVVFLVLYRILARLKNIEAEITKVVSEFALFVVKQNSPGPRQDKLEDLSIDHE